MNARVPFNERRRLEVLDDLDVLDTMPEEAFDRITRLAAKITDTPIVLVSLVDRERQWFKSRIGLDAQETHRNLAFCAHAILDDEVMVVHNAADDPRFATNPLVTGAPDIRFYAGAPLIVDDDLRVGTLCAIDTVPRDLTADQLEALRDLAAVVVDELELRRSLRVQADVSSELRRQSSELRTANEALEQFAYIAAHDLRAPLKQIINVADLGLDDEPEQAQQYLATVQKSARVLENMVVGYRGLAKLERSNRNDEPQMISALVASANSHTATDVDITITGDQQICCDETLMSQVFANLIGNAHKHAPGAQVAIEVSRGHQVTRISVTNPVAEPIPVDDSVLMPFRRLSSTKVGDGLGLAIVDRIVRLHGGTVAASCADQLFEIVITVPDVHASAPLAASA